jgi:hypothetical protein
MLAQITPRQPMPIRTGRPALPTWRAPRRGVAFIVVAITLLAITPGVLRRALPAPILSISPAQAPALHDPLPARVRYIQALIADAEYHLALAPRVITVWRWQIEIRPVQTDPQVAWDDIVRIAPVAQDQPEVFSLLGHIQRTYQRLAGETSLAQQAHAAYTPDYAPVKTLLDVIATDLTATLSRPTTASDSRTCPVCGIE